MMTSTKNTLALTAGAFALAIVTLAGTASAQLYSNYGTYGYSNPLTYGSSAYGNGYSYSGYGTPYNYASRYGYGYSGYGGYGYNNQARFMYRSPSSFDKNDDAYHRKDKTSVQKGVQRFRDLREDTRSRNNYYSNDIYEQNHPYDSRYYDRNIR